MTLPIEVLETDRLRLEPLSLELTVPLCIAVKREPNLFRYLALDPTTPGAAEAWMVNAMKNMCDGKALHFVIIEKATQSLIGHTAVVSIDAAHRRGELAWTWLFKTFQRRGYAVESKKKLYAFLFERCGLKRVQVLVDERNVDSVRSIKRSGAKLEGVLRNHQKTIRGDWRNTIIFSLTDDDWITHSIVAA
jgi:RimJ/RimL family protein N-acetyltransferase